MGEFDVILEDVFQNGQPLQDPKWFPLESRRTGKKKAVVTGEIQIQFSLVDTSNPNASSDDLMKKFISIAAQTPSPDEDEDEYLLRTESAENDDQEEDEEESSDEALDESKKAEKREKRRKKLRLAKLKKANKLRTYEFSEKTEVAGVLFLEITKVTDLPPERNGRTCLPVLHPAINAL